MCKGRGEWIVTKGGLSSAKYATVLSRHTVWERAQAARAKAKLDLQMAGDRDTPVCVEHVDQFVKDGGVL